MQRCKCTVRLSGDVGNTVEKEGVSPAEIVILRDIHGGPDAVVNIRPTEMDKEPHAKERARLVNIYGHHCVDRIFPGAYSQLPVSLKDIEIPEEAEEEDPMAEKAPEPLGEDDQALVDLIQGTKAKGDLYQLAKDNEVNLKALPEKASVEDTQAFILAALFPQFRKK